jgi:hypothetical protein
MRGRHTGRMARDGPHTADELTRAILAALVIVLRRRGLLTDETAGEIAQEAFDIIRPPLLPERLGGAQAVERHQLESLRALQEALALAGLPTEFLPLPRRR